MLDLNPYPQTPFPGKGALLLGLPPLDPVGGYAPATPFLYNQEVYRQTEPRRSLCEVLWWGNVQKRFRSDNNSVKAARIKKIVYDIFKIEKLVPYPVIINV